MKFQKKVLGQMERCYAVEVMKHRGENCVFFATEGKNGGCIAVNTKNWNDIDKIWEEPGGTMSMVPLDEKRGFLAIQKFYRLYDWEEAELVWCRPEGKEAFQVKTLFRLPYIHRFDVLKRNGEEYLICCTLAAHKKERADWSQPGGVYVAQLPKDLNKPVILNKLNLNIYQNHGFTKKEKNGHDAAFIGGREGIFCVEPPQGTEENWTITKVFGKPVSDMDWIDIDGDGQLELATIEEFHGCYYRIYKQTENGFKQVFQHPEVSEFYHVVKSGILLKQPVFLGGCRRGRQQLFAIGYKNGDFQIHTIEEGVGPSNALIYNGPDGDFVCSANREIGEAAVYLAVKEN